MAVAVSIIVGHVVRMDEDFLDLIDQAFLEGQIDGETGTGRVSFSECCDTNPGYVLPEIVSNVLSSFNRGARKKPECEKSVTTENAQLLSPGFARQKGRCITT